MHTATELAQYIVDKAIETGIPVRNMELQKILYKIQQKYFEKYNKMLFPDSFEKKPPGYYIPNVYYAYCHYGVMPITMSFHKPVIDTKTKLIIDPVIETELKIFTKLLPR